MQCSKSPDEIDCVYPNYWSISDQLAQNTQRKAVIRIIERWHQHGRIRDIEVRVARRKTPTAEYQSLRHWKSDYFETQAVFEPRRLQSFDVPFERPMIVVIRFLFAARHDRSRADEPADVIDVPVSVIAFNPATKPNDIRYA